MALARQEDDENSTPAAHGFETHEEEAGFNEVRQFLVEWKLSDLVHLFFQYGITTKENILDLEDGDMDKLGLNTGERVKLRWGQRAIKGPTAGVTGDCSTPKVVVAAATTSERGFEQNWSKGRLPI